MRNRIVSAVIGAVVLGIVSAGPAVARTTITEVCTSGAVITVDAHATHGLVTAENVYNVVNPTGDFCYLVP